jgi:hypothetical protein
LSALISAEADARYGLDSFVDMISVYRVLRVYKSVRVQEVKVEIEISKVNENAGKLCGEMNRINCTVGKLTLLSDNESYGMHVCINGPQHYPTTCTTTTMIIREIRQTGTHSHPQSLLVIALPPPNNHIQGRQRIPPPHFHHARRTGKTSASPSHVSPQTALRQRQSLCSMHPSLILHCWLRGPRQDRRVPVCISRTLSSMVWHVCLVLCRRWAGRDGRPLHRVLVCWRER